MEKIFNKIWTFLSNNWIVIVIVIFLVMAFKPLQEFFKTFFGSITNTIKGITSLVGITDSQATTNVNDEIKNDVSPFSPTFYKKNQIEGKTVLKTLAGAIAIAKDLRDKTYKSLYTNLSEIKGILSYCKNQCSISQICEQYFIKYGRDMLSDISHPTGTTRFGLSDSDTDSLISWVKSLPKN